MRLFTTDNTDSLTFTHITLKVQLQQLLREKLGKIGPIVQNVNLKTCKLLNVFTEFTHEARVMTTSNVSQSTNTHAKHLTLFT